MRLSIFVVIGLAAILGRAAGADELNPPNPTEWVTMAITYKNGDVQITPHVPGWLCRSRGPLEMNRSGGNRLAMRGTKAEDIDPATLAIMVNCEPEQ